jgi:hypothetical protein
MKIIIELSPETRLIIELESNAPDTSRLAPEYPKSIRCELCGRELGIADNLTHEKRKKAGHKAHCSFNRTMNQEKIRIFGK